MRVYCSKLFSAVAAAAAVAAAPAAASALPRSRLQPRRGSCGRSGAAGAAARELSGRRRVGQGEGGVTFGYLGRFIFLLKLFGTHFKFHFGKLFWILFGHSLDPLT